MIGIIDYGMGNLRSVQKAFEHVGAPAELLAQGAALSGRDDIERLVLPGVGAFADGMSHLEERGWPTAIRDYLATGRPFLGICLGLQLLFEGSEEDAHPPDELVPGLGILPGRVVRFPDRADGERVKVPHMGWNELTWSHDDPLLAGLDQEAAVYFVHGFYAQPDDPAIVATRTEYPGTSTFCSAVRQDNVWATQFHPEKSQRVGLAMLANFAGL